ncbi:hypothetical protein P691DRAFT_119176 [Macrolepiota fuliginosa MF-IS2]|uniref:Uncharacterized protein n=1 Tax=Macrolepiota fuliginosa MF-IS2 TaxID=1400762 RepID=A0A9P5XKG0_9AGAR|nr:hypothetical protein P691DRAFT_119176 [Macrolepiota fuliginosa MF-IS2]
MSGSVKFSCWYPQVLVTLSGRSLFKPVVWSGVCVLSREMSIASSDLILMGAENHYCPRAVLACEDIIIP